MPSPETTEPEPEGTPSVAHAHLATVQRALEQAKACLMGETPPDMTPNEAWGRAVDSVRNALYHHIPAVRRKL